MDLSELEGTEDGSIGVAAAASTASGRVSIEPSIGGARVNPEGETSARDKSFVIVLPVADAVLLLWFVGHASNLADVTVPRLFVQQGQQHI